MNEEVCYVLALKSISGVGDVLAKQLISYCGSAEAVFRESKGKLKKIPLIGDKVIEAISSEQTLKRASENLELCIKEQVRLIPYYHSDYPERLKTVNDAPLLLYYKGAENSYKEKKIVGIVGTRKASSYGKEMTTRIVEELVPHEALIVSGLAYGIDIAAHKAALDHGLPTIGVLAGGIDKVYPAAHRKIAEDLLSGGGLISEQSLGMKPDAHFFPARNRIIAGMSDVLIVVEAAKKGGALITANIAYSYNREVFAVPGALTNKYSEGCNELLRKQRASIYTCIEDIEYLLNWEKGAVASKPVSIDLSSFSDFERSVIRVLSEFTEGLPIDELSWKSQIPVNSLSNTLLSLEFSGIIQSRPGKVFVLKRTDFS